MHCRKCGSVNLKAFNLEMGLADAEHESVYALFRPTICLECGFAKGVLSEESLEKLRKEAARGFWESHRDPEGGGRSTEP